MTYKPYYLWTREQKRRYWEVRHYNEAFEKKKEQEEYESRSTFGWTWDKNNNWEDWGDGRDS